MSEEKGLKPFDIFSSASTHRKEGTHENISKALLVLLPTFKLKVLQCLELKAARGCGWVLRAR